MTPSVASQLFGHLPSGAIVTAWMLRNSAGLTLEILNWGGVINRLCVPDRDGQLCDVVLGFNDVDAFYPNAPYIGAIAGRIAGRVPGGEIEVDGERFSLPLNEAGLNHLHGGDASIAHRIWSVEPCEVAGAEVAIRLTLISPDGDNGYPGEVTLRATYALTADNELIFVTEAESDRATPITLTQHAYFNLAGEGNGSIEDHTLQIASQQIIPVDADFTPQGRKEDVAGKPEDFSAPAIIGERLAAMAVKHGDAYWLGQSDDLRAVATVQCPRTGIAMEISSDETNLQLYLAMHMDGSLVGKSQRPYGPYSALCLECQGYPGATTVDGFGDLMVRPGQAHRHETRYRFSTTA